MRRFFQSKARAAEAGAEAAAAVESAAASEAPASASASTPPPYCPELVYLIPDLHGARHALHGLWEALAGDIAARGAAQANILYLGDYIDRGEDSAGVLHDLVTGEAGWAPVPLTQMYLRGNHEQMLLDFLDDPEADGARWLRHGGMQTLVSYGLGAAGLEGIARGKKGAAGSGGVLFDLAAELRAALPEGTESWLRGLPLWYTFGNVAAVHAGLDPSAPLERQRAQACLWGHRDFTKRAREDGLWVVHGHVIHTAPKIDGGRIALDTGAYATGRLVALALDPGGYAFVER